MSKRKLKTEELPNPKRMKVETLYIPVIKGCCIGFNNYFSTVHFFEYDKEVIDFLKKQKLEKLRVSESINEQVGGEFDDEQYCIYDNEILKFTLEQVNNIEKIFPLLGGTFRVFKGAIFNKEEIRKYLWWDFDKEKWDKNVFGEDEFIECTLEFKDSGSEYIIY